MKIRIKGNSIRFRLTQSEVKTLTEIGFIEEKVLFESNAFKYAIQITTYHEKMNATFSEGKITLHIPRAKIEGWYTSTIIGFENVQELSSGDKLYLLLEKDFTCLDNTIEDQSDNYPNPKTLT
ncbi:hypothetical protein MTsPCn9_26010 [Croceitalea sp. MTPC9]|uniref:DUF7009 family protein n=1 Tax=unclassified Croceitalea TaxID=2632280 RepID=UPI002B3FCA7A|nr:hypothetical protein MTsPCn6_28520 [Croceitalea sp. MTPC6]GMN17663.1 hypothetical protein MTsPCn9_26010 [Croceitalea sp. MTPC9]